jgi:hypothetical protein
LKQEYRWFGWLLFLYADLTGSNPFRIRAISPEIAAEQGFERRFKGRGPLDPALAGHGGT